MKVAFSLNGAPVEVAVRPDENLLTVLRRDLGVHSVRETCGLGVCGGLGVAGGQVVAAHGR